jgi:hypothetical protein
MKKSHIHLKSPGFMSDRNASLYKSENFDRRVRLRTSGTLLTSFIMAFRSHVLSNGGHTQRGKSQDLNAHATWYS